MKLGSMACALGCLVNYLVSLLLVLEPKSYFHRLHRKETLSRAYLRSKSFLEVHGNVQGCDVRVWTIWSQHVRWGLWWSLSQVGIYLYKARHNTQILISITAYCQLHRLSAGDCVEEMRQAVYDKTRLTASAGIAPNKVSIPIYLFWYM